MPDRKITVPDGLRRRPAAQVVQTAGRCRRRLHGTVPIAEFDRTLPLQGKLQDPLRPDGIKRVKRTVAEQGPIFSSSAALAPQDGSIPRGAPTGVEIIGPDLLQKLAVARLMPAGIPVDIKPPAQAGRAGVGEPAARLSGKSAPAGKRIASDHGRAEPAPDSNQPQTAEADPPDEVRPDRPEGENPSRILPSAAPD